VGVPPNPVRNSQAGGRWFDPGRDDAPIEQDGLVRAPGERRRERGRIVVVWLTRSDSDPDSRAGKGGTPPQA